MIVHLTKTLETDVAYWTKPLFQSGAHVSASAHQEQEVVSNLNNENGLQSCNRIISSAIEMNLVGGNEHLPYLSNP
jgi:hypothetical protein